MEHSDSYSKTETLWQFYRDEPALTDNDVIIDFPADFNNSNSFGKKF